MLRLAAVVALAGCLHESAVTCGDHTICPTGLACARVEADRDPLCVPATDFASCDGLAAGEACVADGGPGTCFAAIEGVVCVASVCGDGLQDLTEACDDGNRVAGDHCSADCRSTESCGNGVLDGIAFEQCDDGNLVDHDGCDSTCRPERAVWTELAIDRMPPRIDAAMAYDIDRRVAVLFGGFDTTQNAALDDTWLWNGAGWSRASPTTHPSARSGAGMAYDARRGHIILFGGSSVDGTLGDTWEWDGATWTRRATAIAPPPRQRFGIAYDGHRDRVVVFGGIDTDGGIFGANPTADTWEWDGTLWTEITPATAPSARADHAMAYDPRRDRVVVFGGIQGSGGGLAPSLVWEYDGTTWTSHASPSPPTPRQGARMAWDARSQATLVFGGADASGDRDDLWSWDGATWTESTASPRPPARSEHVVADDPIGGRFIVAGLHDETVVTTFVWDHSTWTSGVLPDPRNGEYLSAFDPLRGLAVLVDQHFATWESDGRSWIATGATAPYAGAMTYDPVRQRTVLFGGNDGSNYLDTTLLWDGAAWEKVATTVQPAARTDAAMGFDVSRGQAVLFGGAAASVLGDTWIWDAAGWHAASPAHVPPPRAGHVLGYDPIDAQLVMFGGTDSTNALLDDTWVWTGADWEDRSGPLATRPPARSGAAIAYDGARRRLVMFAGGSGIEGTLQDVWEWNGTGWTTVPTDVSPSHRIHAALFPAASGAGLVAIGGHGAAILSHADDHWLLRWDGERADQACTSSTDDQDHDGVVGCTDRDCWATCTPLCPPGLPCDAAAPRCGDGACTDPLETCRDCPGDCGTCKSICGDAMCEPAEACPGDCP